MPLSRLEKIGVGVAVLGGLSIWGGDIADRHFRSQIKIDVPVATVRELEEKIGSVSRGVHDVFYRRDSKGYDRPASVFLKPENRQAIAEAWRDYDTLMAEYEAAISQPGVKELIEKNRSLNNSAMGSIVIGYSAAMVLLSLGATPYLVRLIRTFNPDYSKAHTTSTQGSH